jgi:uncharacterized protein YaaN involved in tellurite resistance
MGNDRKSVYSGTRGGDAEQIAPAQERFRMPDARPSAPLDLSAFDDLESPPSNAVVVPDPRRGAPVPTHPVLTPQPAAERLVDIDNMKPEEIEAATLMASRIDFRRTVSLLSHGDDVLADISQASRRLLVDAQVGEIGDVGKIAAAVLDGVKILRIEDLQSQANATPAERPKGFVQKLLHNFTDAHDAYKGFQENRRRFLDMMDGEQAKARKSKADLTVTIELLDQQSAAIRKNLHSLKIAIAAGQIALDSADVEQERLRQAAIASGDPAEAADVLEFRGAMANFRGKIAEMRETLVGAAMLIPIIGQNRKAAETRLMKISNGILVVIPKLMAVASQAVVQVQLRKQAEQGERLAEADRQVTLLASKGAHEAAVNAARSLGEDPRNIAVLAQVADETVKTMHEVLDIERQIAAEDRGRETRLVEIKTRLLEGMRSVNQRGTESVSAR